MKRLVRFVTVALASVYAKRENARIQPAIGPAVLKTAHASRSQRSAEMGLAANDVRPRVLPTQAVRQQYDQAIAKRLKV